MGSSVIPFTVSCSCILVVSRDDAHPWPQEEAASRVLNRGEKVLTLVNSTRPDSSHRYRWRVRPDRHTRRSISVQPSLLPVVLAALVTLSGCHAAPRLPDKNSKTYADVVSAFYVGLAALQVGDDVHAES